MRPATSIVVRSSGLRKLFQRLQRLPGDYLAQYAGAPWTSIVGIGNVLQHEYQRLDDRQLWEIATIHLPAMEPVARRMIAELDD
jgi:uncharacterized protein with HEPN domain